MTTTHWSTRRDLTDAPPEVQAWLRSTLGGDVVSWRTAVGGFSPGIAARVVTANGQRAFVKAVDGSDNAETPELFRREVAALRILSSASGAEQVIAPLLASYDDGEWVALLLPEIDGTTPAQPFVADEVAVIDHGLTDLARFLSSVHTEADLPRLGIDGALTTRWQAVADDHLNVAHLDPWVVANLDLLLELAEHGRTAVQGDDLLHFDMRSDNILLTSGLSGPSDPSATSDRRAVFVDWAWLRRGAPWCDAALFGFDLATAPSAVRAEDFVRASVLLRDVPPRDLTSFVALITGGQTYGSLQPAPPGLPGMRSWQVGMAAGGLAWLRERIDAGLV